MSDVGVRMRSDNIKDMFGLKRAGREEVREIEPRSLSDREAGWIRDILHVNPEWCGADTTKTKVVAEGPNADGYSVVLQAPAPENPRLSSTREMVGQLWIEADDRSTINVQLSQFNGSLQEIYVLVIDRKGRNRTTPETWNEVSRQAVNC
jgi:hypothetical protein